MKIAVLLILLPFFVSPVTAETVLLRGIVTLQNSHDPVNNVIISAFGANQVTSNSAGQFELSFPEKSAGTPVTITVQKKGLEVVNRTDLEQVILRKDPDDLLRIVLCPTGKWTESAASYYQIVLRDHNNEIAEIKAEMQKLPANSDSLTKLHKRVDKRSQEWLANQVYIKEPTQQFASVNLDNADSLYKAAFSQFSKGEIAAAHRTLNGEMLEKNLLAAQAELQVVDTLEKEVKDRKINARKAVESTIESFKLKGQFFITQMKWDSAEVYYLNFALKTAHRIT